MPAPPGNCLLCLDIEPGHPVQLRKLAGVRRYAALRGGNVACIARRDMADVDLRTLLARHRPVGVIVEGSGRRKAYPPRLFGRMPVSYIEYPAEETAGRAPNVSIDDGAIADAAFRELSLGNPTSFAVLGHKNPHLWSSLRVQAFRDRCAKAGAAAESATVVILRKPGRKYAVTFEARPVQAVAKNTKSIPDAFIAKNGHDVTPAFLAWARPLAGALPACEVL